jgi:hypothetical protein
MLIFKKFSKITNTIRSVVPKKTIYQIYLIYFCLIITAFLEMIGYKHYN